MPIHWASCAWDEKKDLGANDVAEAFKLDMAPLMGNGVVFVKLQLRDESGQPVSENFYWLGASSASYRKLNRMGDATIAASARIENRRIAVSLQNTANVAALATKLTLLRTDGARVLPAYYSDNYISLLPGERREITVEYPEGTGAMQIGIRGWSEQSSVQ
jgi:FtsP/CotA-like multicopper oxidase with cupredoxin domain